MGVCGGSAVVDECGVCDGSGIADGACDCEGNVDLGCGCGEAAAEENYDCDGNCIAGFDYCGECGGDNSSCESYPTVLTAEEWTAVSVNGYGNPDCEGDIASTSSGPFDLAGYSCDNVSISLSANGSFTATCETAGFPAPVSGTWVVYNDATICLAVGSDTDCADYSYFSADNTFSLSGTGDDGNCYDTVFALSSTLSITDIGIPSDFNVYQNYPNPFNPSTTIEFDIATLSNISLAVYDLTGKEVYSLANGYHAPGRYSVVWNAMDMNGESVSSGMYIYQLRTSESVITKKLVLLR